ncbi:hypothetical protein [Streptomyces lavendulae]|uniref:hypothetical protein n=1 Tax=Streptomyces lavendulae TaxID=1914 RepID=UPI0024A47E78|nr:hypothetical protein Slala05_29220 [Streptomyces lavendulae subsp. lavendulae]
MPDAAALLDHDAEAEACDAEAEAYDATRGGVPRAGAAAAAALGLLPPHARTLLALDLGCGTGTGTGTVTARLAALPRPDVARPEPAYRVRSSVRA